MIKSNVAIKVNPSVEELAQYVECGPTDRKRESILGREADLSKALQVQYMRVHLGINSCTVV